jgi:TatD DNase family protein
MSDPGPAARGREPLVDSHCHLQILAEREGGSGVERALELAVEAGVVQVVCPGLNLEDSDRCREIAEAHPGVFFTVGWHPHERSAPDRAQLGALDQLLGHPRAVGVGEVGLDQYWRPGYHETPLEVQQTALRQMLELARAHVLPVVIHDRDSHDQVLTAVDAVPGVRGVMHSYTGDPEHALSCRARGFLLSFSGIVTFPRSEAIREAARTVDGAGYLVETDTPFLAPVPHRGQPNTPAFVVATAAAVARLRGVDPATVAAETTSSARRLFGLPVDDLLRG